MNRFRSFACWLSGSLICPRPGSSLLVVVAGALLSGALLLAGCSESTRSFTCPTGGREGPALDPAHRYLVVASTLSEEWTAARRHGADLVALGESGLTGIAPNDVDVVGDHLFIVNSGDNTISVVDLGDGTTVACIGTGTGTNPWEFTVDPTDSTRGWATMFLTGELLELNLDTFGIVSRKHIGSGLEGVIVTDTEVAVTLTGFLGDIGAFEDGTVVVLDKDSLDEIRRHRVPANAQTLFRGADDRFHVICTGDFAGVPGSVVRIEPDWSAVRDTLVLGGSPSRAAVAADGTAYVAGFFGGVNAYDTVGFTLVPPLSGDVGFTAVAVADTVLYAANFDQDAVVVFDLRDGNVTQTLLVGDGPIAIALYR